MFDTHCHLTSKEFAGRVSQVLQNASLAGVRGAITIGTTAQDSLQASKLASDHGNVWCSAGVHPLHSDEPLNWEMIRLAAENPKCIAWGELGLDNHYREPARSIQDAVLAEQLAFIESCHKSDPRLVKPIVIHCREAFDDVLAALRTTSFDPTRIVFHCFTGTTTEAKRVLDFGAWISFTGVVTFANAPEVAEAAKLVPADRIMVETDAPFLTPEPHRKIRPNEPKFVPFVARRIAELRGVEPTDFDQQLDRNAERFFGITIPS